MALAVDGCLPCVQWDVNPLEVLLPKKRSEALWRVFTEVVLCSGIRDASFGFKGKIYEFQSQIYQCLTFHKMLTFSKLQFSFL